MIESLSRSMSLGPVNFPLFIVPVLIGWIVYQIVIKRVYKGRGEQLQKTDRLMFNGLFIILIVWKLSPLLFQFNTVVKNPAAALYLPGGSAGVILGIAAAFVYILVHFMKEKEVTAALLKSLGFNFGTLLVIIAVAGIITAYVFSSEDPANADEAGFGVEAPDFSLEAEDGGSYSLSDYEGKTVVLNFWASWCPPCRAELPELKSYYEGLGVDGAVFLSVNLYSSERDPEGLPAFIEEQALTFPVLYDKSGQVAAAYGVESIPTTVVIGPDSIISAVKKGAVTEAWLKRAVE